MSSRIAIVIPVRFSLGGHAVQTTTDELSGAEVLVRCLESPPVGAQLALRLYLPGGHLAEFGGYVREHRKGKEKGFLASLDGPIGAAREDVEALLAAHGSGGWRTPTPMAASHPRGLTEAPVPLPAPSPEQLSKATDSQEGNRRVFARHRTRFTVQFASADDFVLQYAANISAGGVFITTDSPPPMDTTVTVTLELPGGDAPVTARGQIVHRVTPDEAEARGTDAGAGVQFVDADDAFREAIDRAIDFILRGPKGSA